MPETYGSYPSLSHVDPSITIAIVVVKPVSLRVLPRLDKDKIRHETRDLAFEDGRVTDDHVCVVRLGQVLLGNHWKLCKGVDVMEGYARAMATRGVRQI